MADRLRTELHRLRTTLETRPLQPFDQDAFDAALDRLRSWLETADDAAIAAEEARLERVLPGVGARVTAILDRVGVPRDEPEGGTSDGR